MYEDLGLGQDGKLVFFITNSGYVGEFDLDGKQKLRLDEGGKPVPKIDEVTGLVEKDGKGEIQYQGMGEKITVHDSKTLVGLVEHRKIESWIIHPAFGYWIPDPKELEERHGMKGFAKRFNPLRFYSPEEILVFWERDIEERTKYMDDLFNGQELYEQLLPVINVWKDSTIPSAGDVKAFFETNYGKVV
jgi:hypothetical protein